MAILWTIFPEDFSLTVLGRLFFFKLKDVRTVPITWPFFSQNTRSEKSDEIERGVTCNWVECPDASTMEHFNFRNPHRFFKHYVATRQRGVRSKYTLFQETKFPELFGKGKIPETLLVEGGPPPGLPFGGAPILRP